MLDQGFHRFGPFVIIRTLGRGGMGEVFVARTPWAENPLAAVKRLRPDVARVPTFAERFAHEAELAVRLGHTNVVATLDVGSVEGQLYVASELILGKDTGLVADRLRERGQGGPAAVAIRLLLDTLAGLAYVHGAREASGAPLKLVHRDVTPGNVLVGYDGLARLADFGLAKSLLTEKSNLTNHGEILGTPHYLAPEVIRGEQASPASDLYGLGAVMYRFLTGVAPHQGTTAEVLLKVLSEEPRPLSDLRPDLPPWLVVFIHRLLEKDPTHRPYDAAILHKQLLNDAKASGLLVPKAAVGRWLGTLFETEKAEEVEEYERVAELEPDAIPEEPEGTVVLARPRTGSRLEAPSPVEEEYLDSQGTELDLSEADVRAVAARPVVRTHNLDDTAEGSDVTQAAQVAHFPNELSDPDLYDEPESMPTKAVTVLGQGFDGGFDSTAHRAEPMDPDTHDDDVEATRFGKFVESQRNAAPGFVDHQERPPEPNLSTYPSPRPARRKNPESVIVSPAPSARSKPASVPPERSEPPVRRSDPAARARPSGQTPVRATPSKGKARPPTRKKKKASMGRNLLLLTGLLCIAVALGIGIGVLVASLKTPNRPVPIKSNAALQTRFQKLQTEMTRRSQRNLPVPPRAWELMTQASSALMQGNDEEAKKKLEEAERLLAAQPSMTQR